MADNAQNFGTDNASSGLPSLLAAFRHVGLPLLQALAESSGSTSGEEPASGLSGESYAALVDSTIALSRELAAQLGAEESGLDPSVRWALSGAASKAVAASFRATNRVMTPEETKRLAGLAAEVQAKFKGQIPAGGESVPNTVAAFRAQLMEAMVPVVGAVAQYAFGRAEHGLLAEVAEQLVRTSDQVTRSLAPTGATPEEWRLLCWNILRASGQIYAECHYAEADRLLYMNPEDRAAYFAGHENIVPMTQVWQAFRQRMAMLATLAMYLDVPATARLEEQSWP